MPEGTDEADSIFKAVILDVTFRIRDAIIDRVTVGPGEVVDETQLSFSFACDSAKG
jgi:hypothetical protein